MIHSAPPSQAASNLGHGHDSASSDFLQNFELGPLVQSDHNQTVKRPRHWCRPQSTRTRLGQQYKRRRDHSCERACEQCRF